TRDELLARRISPEVGICCVCLSSKPLPKLIYLCAQNFLIFPAIVKSQEAIAADNRPQLRTDENFRIFVMVSIKPELQQSFRKRKPLIELPREISLPVRNRNLNVMAIEWPKVKLLGMLNQIGPNQQSFREVLGHQMFDDGKM